MPLVPAGTVTFDPERPVEDGKVFIPDPPPDEDRPLRSATIEAVTAPGEAEPSGYTAAPTLRTEGVIYPGLIDLHSHLAYNWRSLWFPLGGAVHGPEPVASRGHLRPGDQQARCGAGHRGGEGGPQVRGGEGARGGNHRHPGFPGLSRPYEGWLVRNIEHESFGTGEDFVFQSVINLDVEGLRSYAERMRDGRSFIYHLAEGTDTDLVESSGTWRRPTPSRRHSSPSIRPGWDARSSPGWPGRRVDRVVPVLQPFSSTATPPTWPPPAPKGCGYAWAPTGAPRARRTSW